MPIDVAIKQIASQKLLLADPNHRYRSVMARYLRSIGMEVLEASNVAEAIEAIQTLSPDLVALDVELGNGVATTNSSTGVAIYATGTAAAMNDPQRCLRAAAERHASDRPVRFMLTCKAHTPRERILSLITPAVGAVAVTPCRPETMIEKLAGMLDPHAKSIIAPTHSNKPISTVASNNSLLVQQLLCPFHERNTLTHRYALRLNRIETEQNFFDVPVYTHAIGHSDYVNYHQLCITVCPECLFASADPCDFLFPHDRRHITRTLPSAARYAIISRVAQRRALLGDVPKDFFTENRSREDAIKSFELALHCSTTLHEVAPRQLSEELTRQGNYHLRIALLQEQMGEPQLSRDRHIERAGELLKEAFPTLPEPAIPRSVYQVVATSIYMGEDHEAHQYLTQLARLSKTAKDPATKRALDRYLGRSARAWENRDEHRRPPLPVPAAPAPVAKADKPTPFLDAA